MLPDVRMIKIRRQKLGLKQKDLAEMADVSQSFIAKLESFRLEPSYSIVMKIFNCLESLEHKSEKTAGDIMTRPIKIIKKGDSIKKAVNLMKANSISQLPVIKGKRVVGGISESLILDKIIQGISKEELFEMAVTEIMEEPFPIVRADMPASIVLPLLKSSEAILVSRKENIVGIITKANSI